MHWWKIFSTVRIGGRPKFENRLQPSFSYLARFSPLSLATTTQGCWTHATCLQRDGRCSCSWCQRYQPEMLYFRVLRPLRKWSRRRGRVRNDPDRCGNVQLYILHTGNWLPGWLGIFSNNIYWQQELEIASTLVLVLQYMSGKEYQKTLPR